MPDMKKPELSQRIDDLEEGTILRIISIGETEKTESGFDKITVTLDDESQIIGMGVAVRKSLEECRDDESYVFSVVDPIIATVGKYQSHGKTCTCLN